MVAENINPCQSPLATQSILQSSETVTINGIPFLKQTGADAGVGHLHQWIAYSTFKDNACVSLDFILHSLQPGNYATPPPVFDYAAEIAVFGDMVSTFTWLTPPPTPIVNGWLPYTNSYYGFEFKYPPQAQIISQQNNFARIDLPFTPGTNLKEKYLEVIVAENISPCQSPLATQSMLQSSEAVTINGIPFLKQTGEDGGAGHLHQWIAYSTFRNNACVSLDFILHSLNAGNFPTPPPVFDYAAETVVFGDMVSTFAWLAPTSTPTPSPIATGTPPPTNMAVVQSVEIQILESQPLQVNAIVRGQLPNVSCTKISSVSQVRDGNTFRLTLTTATDPLLPCAPALAPFEQIVPLDVSNLPPAKYTVNANGVEQTFELVTRDLTKFGQAIVDALNTRNFDTAKVLMDEIFGFAYWGSQGTTSTPDLAIEGLRTNYLGTTPLTPNPGKDLNTLLGGLDPYAIMGLDPNKSQALFVSGWGLDGKGEAILYTTRLADGSLYWHSVLIAPTGFTPVTALKGPYAVVNVAGNDTLNIRSNPGVNQPIIGSYPSNATDVMETGASASVDGAVWVEVHKGDGLTGWVNSYYLTEYISHDAFCADTRIAALIGQLKGSMNQSNGNMLSAITSPVHGVNVHLWAYGPGVNFTQATAANIFADTTPYNWGGGPSGLPDTGTFNDLVKPKYLEVFNAANMETYCDNLTKVFTLSRPWPYENIHYYNLYKPATPNIVFDFRTLLIGVEYINGQPYLYSIVTIVWEP